MPYAIKKIVKKAEFEKARAYGFDKSSYGFVSDLWNQLETVVYFSFGILPYFWDLSGKLLENTSFKSELFQSLGFAGIACVAMTVTNLPFSLYFTFVIEQKHGFNKSTLGTFLMDKIKTILLIFLIGGPFLAGFIYLIDNHRQNFAFYVWIFVFSFQLFFYTIFPTFIQPLFNKFEPLPEGELKTKIDELAKKIKFPLKKIFVIDGSKRSSHSNAYFFGLFNNKRIVLYDTLLEQCNTQEILAILGHELGHWKLDHIWKRLFAIQFHFFMVLYTFGFVLNLDSLYHSFGFSSKPVVVGFLLFQVFPCYAVHLSSS
jgi:STE24 endopeptidase